MNDPTLQELHAVMAGYDDPNDKLTIALGNFNRVRAERDASREREQELERERDSYAAQYDEVVKEAGALLEREQELTNALRDVDAYLADPAGSPIDAINFARGVIRAALAPTVEEQR